MPAPTNARPRRDGLMRVTLNIPADVFAEAQRLALSQGINVTSYLRDALLTEKFFLEARRRGEKILLQDKTGRRKEIIFKR